MFRLKNITGSLLDVESAGVIFQAAQTVDFDTDSDLQLFSEAINAGQLVLVDSQDIQLTEQESQDFVNTPEVPIYEDPNPTSISAADVGAVPDSDKGQANGVATLDSSGKIPATQIPAVALPQVFVVADQAERDTLSVQEGDEAIALDGNHWIYDGSAWQDKPGALGDVAGPNSSINGELVVFDQTSGKIIRGTGILVTGGQIDGRDISADGISLDDHIGNNSNPHNTSRAQLGAAALNGSASEVFNVATPTQPEHAANKAYVDLKTSNINVYGTEFHLFESLHVTTVYDDEWYTKLNEDLSNLPAGKYEIKVTYGWNCDTTSSDFIAAVFLDNSQIGEEHRQEPKDSGGSFGSTGTDQKHYTHRVFYEDLDGNHNIKVKFYGTDDDQQASMWDLCVKVVRVQ